VKFSQNFEFMKQNFLLLFSFIFLSFFVYWTFGQTSSIKCPVSSQCGNTPLTGNGQNATKVACVVNTNYLLLVVEVNNGSESRWYQYCLLTDNLYQLLVNGSYAWLSSSTSPSSAYVQMWVPGGLPDGGDVSSYRRAFFASGTNFTLNTTDTQFVLYYSGLISLNNGLFTDVNDTTNVFFENMCSYGYCILDTGMPCINNVDCGITLSEANNNSTGLFPSIPSKDVKIMLGFQGTDGMGNYLKSANLLPSQFRQYSFSNYYGLVASVPSAFQSL
jgi:hypothetical protein